MPYHTREIFGKGKLANLANHELFAKNFSTDTPKMPCGICTNCSLFTKFLLTNSFYLYSSPKFSPTKYFPCTVVGMVSWHSLGIDVCCKSQPNKELASVV